MLGTGVDDEDDTWHLEIGPTMSMLLNAAVGCGAKCLGEVSNTATLY